MSGVTKYVRFEKSNRQWRKTNEKKGREGGRILGKRDGERVCAALIRLWGQRQKEWREP